MSRLFSTSARALLSWSGFDRFKLPEKWQNAVEKFTEPGGGAETVIVQPGFNSLINDSQKLGKLKRVNIKYRDDNPVHKSHFNRADKEWVISAEISGVNGRKTCHIYEDGTGTTQKGEERR